MYKKIYVYDAISLNKFRSLKILNSRKKVWFPAVLIIDENSFPIERV